MGLVLLVCAILLTSHGVKSAKEAENIFDRKYFQNLTDPINDIIANENPVSTQDLQMSLKWSPLVLYSTDLPLDNIVDILVPVINLLNKFSPQHQLMLSFRYVQQERFMWSRMEDLYYDVSLNISASNHKLISTHLVSIVLDWKTINDSLNCDSFYSKISEGGSEITIKRPHHSFPKYVKGFMELYFENSFIPVGMLYNVQSNPYYCPPFVCIRDQVGDADFHVFHIRLESPIGLYLSPDQDSFLTFVRKKISNSRLTEKNVSLLITITENREVKPTVYWSGNRAVELPYFQNLSQSFIDNLYDKTYLQYFTKMIMNLTASTNVDVILGKLPGNAGVYGITQEKNRHAQWKNVIPFLSSTEGKVNLGDLKNTLNQLNAEHQTIAVNIDAWKVMVRYKQKLEDSETKSVEGKRTSSGPNVILYFEPDTWKIWRDIEPSVKKLLENHRTVHGNMLKTIIFSSYDLEQDNSTIVKFIQSPFISSMGYKIGCAISYRSLVNYIQMYRAEHLSGNASEKFREKASQMCKPIFESVDVLLWTFGWSSSFRCFSFSSFPSDFQDAFLTREIFMREFPDKEVIIQTGLSDDAGKAVADIFDAPVMLNWGTI